MNLQSFLYNENFYRKLALTIALIRSTPSHLTPREFAKQLQQIVRQRQIDRSKVNEQIRLEVEDLRRFHSIEPIEQSIELIDRHRDFLEILSTMINEEFSLEMNFILMDTIKRLFELYEEHLDRLCEEKCLLSFKHSFTFITRFDLLSLIQRHSITCLNEFLQHISNRLSPIPSIDLFIEHIGKKIRKTRSMSRFFPSFRFISIVFSSDRWTSPSTIISFLWSISSLDLRRNFIENSRSIDQSQWLRSSNRNSSSWFSSIPLRSLTLHIHRPSRLSNNAISHSSLESLWSMYSLNCFCFLWSFRSVILFCFYCDSSWKPQVDHEFSSMNNRTLSTRSRTNHIHFLGLITWVFHPFLFLSNRSVLLLRNICSTLTSSPSACTRLVYQVSCLRSC